MVEEARDRCLLDDGHPTVPGAAGQRHGDVDGVGAAVAGDGEAGEHVVDPGEREQLLHLGRRDLADVDTAVPVEGGDPAVFLEAVGVRGELDEADGAEARRLAGLGLQPGVEVPRVHPQLGLGGRHGPERDHQSGGVPRGAGGELVALEEHDVAPAQAGEVVGDAGPDDAAADDDHPGPVRQRLWLQRHLLRANATRRCVCG